MLGKITIRHVYGPGLMVRAEVEAGRVAVADAPKQCHTNPIGVIPKPHRPEKFRTIVDLSAPHDASVNDYISVQLCSLSYASIEKEARLVKAAGHGALMGKLDLCLQEGPCPPTGLSSAGNQMEGSGIL